MHARDIDTVDGYSDTVRYCILECYTVSVQQDTILVQQDICLLY